jgi:RNA polymerase primary sigma factor
MRHVSEEFEEEFGVAPTREELSELLGVSKDTMDSIFSCASTPVSLDTPLRYSSGDSGRTLAEVVPDAHYIPPDAMLETQGVVSAVRSALQTLSPREEIIMRLRFGIADDPIDHKSNPITPKEIRNIKRRNKNEHAQRT